MGFNSGFKGLKCVEVLRGHPVSNTKQQLTTRIITVVATTTTVAAATRTTTKQIT